MCSISRIAVGTIQSGTYDLVSMTVYPGDSGSVDVLSPVRKTVVISVPSGGPDHTFNTQEADLSGNYLFRQNGTITTSGGTTVTFTPTCPAADAGAMGGGTASYTSVVGAQTVLSIFEPHGSGATVLEVYQKR